MQRVLTALGWMIAIATGLAALAFFVVLFVIAVRLVPTGHEGDLGTWAGAVFAGLAFGGTIWIATSQRRSSEREAKSLAAVTLMSMQFRVSNSRRRLETAAIALDQWQPDSGFFVDYRSVGEAIWQNPLLEIAEIEKIVPLDKDVALGMAAAVDFIAYCAPLLEGAFDNPKISSDDMHQRFCGEMSQLLASAAMNFRSAGVLAARTVGRRETRFEDNGIPEIARKNLPPRVL